MEKLKQRAAIRFVVLVLFLSVTGAVAQNAVPKKIVDLKPTVILVSLDGFRWDYPEKYGAPNLLKLAAQGVRAEMIPSFPTKTFPNHYTIVTGLYPGHHGVVANTMWDDEMKAGFKMSDRKAVADSRWWSGEPIWVTAAKRGQKSATLFWPGSEAAIGGVRPAYWVEHDSKFSHSDRLNWVLGKLDLPVKDRPTFLTLYFQDVDDAGHDFGPDTLQTGDAVRRVDATMGRLMAGLRARGIDGKVNTIVVADHGMIATSNERKIFLEDHLDLETVRVVDWSPVLAIKAKDGNDERVFKVLNEIPHLTVYRKNDIPDRFHYKTNKRVAPVIAIAESGWGITTRKHMADRKNPELGAHGYDNTLRDMHAIFIAYGPAFKAGVKLEPVENVDIYNVMCKILGLEAATNDGSIKGLGEGLAVRSGASK